jgi:tetratricopeptide (TPR) repeat protein
MRLGDSIDIPAAFEPAVMHIATQLSRLSDDSTALEQAVSAMQTLLGHVTSDTDSLFRGALLRDLADAVAALPTTHPLRKLDLIEAYYREAIPLYNAVNRPVSVAFTQRSLGDMLSEQERYEEALVPLQAAAHGLQESEQYRDDTVWTLSTYANALDKLGRLHEALASYAEAISLKPDTPPLLRNRAETFIHARQLEEAEADLARAIALDGNEDSSYLWYRRVQLAIARGDAYLADQMIDEVAKREPSFDLRLDQAQSAWLKGDLNTAQDILQKAFGQANSGDRAAMLRDMELLFNEHPGLAGKDELHSLMLKFEA